MPPRGQCWSKRFWGRSARVVLIAALAGIVSPMANADEIYLCDGSVSMIVVPAGAVPRAARDEGCVRSWNSVRKQAELQRLAQMSDPYKEARGVSSRDFCFRGEACNLPLPRWRPRWDYVDHSTKRIFVHHRVERH
jgi:hypothetical protein